MQPVKPAKIQAEINVTPLVDVVLVLLIIFMVIVPIMRTAPPVKLPTTDKPPDKRDDGAQLVITIEHDGAVWIDEERLTPERVGPALLQAADRHGDREVLIMGDARLSFGDVKWVMEALKDKGFSRVGLITDPQGTR